MSETGGRDEPLARYLEPARFVDSDDPAVVAYARVAWAGAEGARARAVRLYYAVRDGIRYDPYLPWAEEEGYRASACLRAKRGFCVPKAVLLAACARAAGIPARVAFADVRNHLCTPRLRALMGCDVFVYHGIAELHLEGRWVKATPTFNIELCDRFGVRPLDFDGTRDALLHPFDRSGRQHMEYLRYHGAYWDVPAQTVRAAMLAAYGGALALSAAGGNFAAEAAAAGEAR